MEQNSMSHGANVNRGEKWKRYKKGISADAILSAAYVLDYAESEW